MFQSIVRKLLYGVQCRAKVLLDPPCFKITRFYHNIILKCLRMIFIHFTKEKEIWRRLFSNNTYPLDTSLDNGMVKFHQPEPYYFLPQEIKLKITSQWKRNIFLVYFRRYLLNCELYQNNAIACKRFFSCKTLFIHWWFIRMLQMMKSTRLSHPSQAIPFPSWLSYFDITHEQSPIVNIQSSIEYARDDNPFLDFHQIHSSIEIGRSVFFQGVQNAFHKSHPIERTSLIFQMIRSSYSLFSLTTKDTFQRKASSVHDDPSMTGQSYGK